MKLTNFFTKSFLFLIIIFLSEINGMKNNSNKSLKKRSKHTEKNFVFKKLNFEGESSNTQNPKKVKNEENDLLNLLADTAIENENVGNGESSN
uniref:Uncharacterized protein n=1 Tax=Meloidogyne enterolobii TaxID=390850 RepID=A0A6V7WBR5_MELEN|nr:unnamed protein product [Meloidogyne enterolobii]